jgi:type VI secretion system secreted protein VgrG
MNVSTKIPLSYVVRFGQHVYTAREVVGEERLSAPFRFECRFLLGRHESIDPDEVVSLDATVEMERNGTERIVTGVVSDVWINATASGVPDLTVVIEPRLAMLRFREDIRLFREKTAVEIVKDVLAGHGIVPELRLVDTYVTRHYCVQIRESDLAFVSRLLEDEGIFYFFTEEGTMVLGDRVSAYDAIPGDPDLPFRPGLGMDGNHDHVGEIGARARYLPGKVSLRDFNPEHPSLSMDVEAKGPTEGGPEHYDFPGEYELPPQGETKVKKRAEALRCASLVHTGRSFTARLAPGRTFDLSLAPAGVEDGGYVVTGVQHDFDVRREGFSVGFDALRSDVLFRPMMETPVPTINDPVTGLVTGPPGEDIHCDMYGRVKVHFHWDRLFPFDDTCSYWIPVLQDNTGHSASIPRIGWEMLVHFLEGDPDRPVVVGRVYNPEDPPHLMLPINKTRSVIKSLTSPREQKRDDSGTNEIFFEDLQKNEFIQYQAQKDQNVVIGRDKTETVLLNQQSSIERDEKVGIGANNLVTIGKHLMHQVKQDQTHSVGGNRKVSVSEADQETVGGTRTMTVGGMHYRRIGSDDTSMAEERYTETVGGVAMEASLKDNTNTGTKVSLLVVGGAHVEIAKNDKNEGVGKARAEAIGGAYMVNAGGEIGLRANKMRATTITGPLRVKSAKEMTLVGREKFLSESLSAKFTGPDGIHLKVGDSQVILKDGALQLDTKDIKLTIGGTNDQGSGKGTQI